jgi:hypothetical protein
MLHAIGTIVQFATMHRTTFWRNNRPGTRTLPHYHRSTKKDRRFKRGWRWVHRPCGRKYSRPETDKEDLQYVAALLEERRRTEDVDYRDVRQELPKRKKRDEVREIYRALLSMWREGTPADRIKTACCHVLRLGPRVRMPSRAELTRHFWTKPAQQLMEKNPGMTQAEAEGKVYVQRLMKASPGLSQAEAESALEETRRTGTWDWLEEKMKDVAHVRPETGRRESREAEIRSTCCVSKVFPNLKRGMASYWRRDTTAFENTCVALRTLIAQRLSGKML